MEFTEAWFEDEVRDGFYIPALMKRGRAAELELLELLSEFWRERGIRWHVAGDTLAGAALCQGYLPWSDRITVSMNRENLCLFAEKAGELPEGLTFTGSRVVNGSETDNCVDNGSEAVSRVANGSGINWSEDFLAHWHGFPYAAAVEILEENAKTAEVSGEKLPAEETAGSDGRKLESLSQGTVTEDILLDFEKLKVPVPADYEKIVAADFGDLHADSREKLRRGNFYAHTHANPEDEGIAINPRDKSDEYPGRRFEKDLREGDYPCYMTQEHQYNRETNMISRCFYQFHRDDLRKPSADEEESIVDSFLETFTEAHRQVLRSVQMTDAEEIIRSFTKAQDTAVKFGNFIEVNFPEAAIVVVPILEAYCNRLYQLGEALKAEGFPTDDEAERDSSELQVTPEDCLEACMKFASAVQAAVQNEILEKREIVFLPFKASGWKNLEPLYRYYKARQDCRVCVVPVPYYHVTDRDTYGEKIYEGDAFPDDVDIISYETFNLYTHRPDSIVTQCPYDQYGMGMRLSADLYAGELQKFTKHLIYVPWFTTDEVSTDDRAAVAVSDYYILQPGVTMSDIVLVQSPQTRNYYIDRLSELCGGQTREIWEKKIQTIEGSVVL